MELRRHAGHLHDGPIADQVAVAVEHEYPIGGRDVPVARILQVEAMQRGRRTLVVGDDRPADRHNLARARADVTGARTEPMLTGSVEHACDAATVTGVDDAGARDGGRSEDGAIAGQGHVAAVAGQCVGALRARRAECCAEQADEQSHATR
ncbi:MAG: hypothetical protein ACRDTA_13665 [Pseudonocardiaceae bacterium]